ncbi:hypothetical protein KJ975_12790 [Myxococcota bacterium]|jgi:hypothetical protein|nr:hypothetical protein [Myxococcota bacterium]
MKSIVVVVILGYLCLQAGCKKAPGLKPCKDMTSLDECYKAAHCVGYMDNVKGDHTGKAWSCEPRPEPEK